MQRAGRILQKSIRILQGCGPSSPTMWSEFSRVGNPNSFPGRVLSYPQKPVVYTGNPFKIWFTLCCSSNFCPLVHFCTIIYSS